MPEGIPSQPEIWIAAGLSILLLAIFIRARLNFLRLPKLPPAAAAPDRLPDAMIVIPARNEEALIARAVSSLPPDSVIVVDDHSEDGTAEAARKAGAGVIPAPPLARGVVGKTHACMLGARALTSRWILFADADTCFAPAFLEAAVAAAESSGAALLSIYLDAECASPGARLLAPYLHALYFCGASPHLDSTVAFNGQCVLARRDAYEFLGGYGAVLNDLNADLRFAAIAQRHRLKIGIARAPGLGTVRFRDLPGTVNRGAFRFMIPSPLLGSIVLVAALAMAAWPPIFVWLMLAHQPHPALAFAIFPFLLVWSWYRSPAVLALPLAIYAALPLLLRGLWNALSGSAVEWKGRSV